MRCMEEKQLKYNLLDITFLIETHFNTFWINTIFQFFS